MVNKSEKNDYFRFAFCHFLEEKVVIFAICFSFIRVILRNSRNEAELNTEYQDVVDVSYKPPFELNPSWQEWESLMPHILENYRAPRQVQFNDDVTQWSIQNHLFFDGDDPNVEKSSIVKRFGYQHRDKLTSDVIRVIDDWWIHVKNKTLINNEVAFLH